VNAVFVWLLSAGTLVLGLAIFLILALACEVGYRFGHRRGAALTEGADHAVTATLTSGMVGLLAFILGLTINFAENRYEARRELVVTVDLNRPRLGAIRVDPRPLEWTIQEMDEARLATPAPPTPGPKP